MSTIQTEIQAINTAFDNAFNSKNAAAVAGLYADNATVMPAPAGAPISGAPAIQAFFGGLIEAGVIEHKLTLAEAVADGNLAYQRGQWAGAMVDAQGVKNTFGGNVHLVYRKQADGSWKAVTHIWN
jgi:ketosteroid isomerase-like protein